MSYDFSRERWATTIDNYEKWWEGTLGRPLIQFTRQGRTPDVPKPEIPEYSFTSFFDLSVPPEEIVKMWEYVISKTRYFGDSFPSMWPNFGAGCIAAFLGCRLENTIESFTTWFHPVEEKEIADLRFEKKNDNVWYQRVRSIMQAAIDYFDGMVQIGMTDLGGNLDILASFRPSEDLLLDLYDDPEAVKARTWEAHKLWFEYFDEMNQILQPTVRNPGYTNWTALLSQKSYYMLQCDFCYMIGLDMFNEFVKPELTAACKRIDRPFYHLDGVGELTHLDSLLEIEELKGVQWVTGDGTPPQKHWPDVFKKIHAAGKLIQLYGDTETLDIIGDALGTVEGIFYTPHGFKDDDEACRLLEKYNVPIGTELPTL